MSNFPIRELCFGPGKTGKTKSHVETYPKPMLVLNTELGGLASVKSIPVQSLNSKDLPALLAKPTAELPPVVAIDYIYRSGGQISLTVAPSYNKDNLTRLITDLNLVSRNCPFNSVMLDHLTGLSESCVGLIGCDAPAFMADSRKWAGAAGAKAQEVVGFMLGLPCPCVVIIAHETTTTDEKANITTTTPMVVGSLKGRLSAMCEQVFYSDTMQVDGKLKYILRTVPFGVVKGLGHKGLRDDMPAVCGQSFKEIYGEWKP